MFFSTHSNVGSGPEGPVPRAGSAGSAAGTERAVPQPPLARPRVSGRPRLREPAAALRLLRLWSSWRRHPAPRGRSRQAAALASPCAATPGLPSAAGGDSRATGALIRASALIRAAAATRSPPSARHGRVPPRSPSAVCGSERGRSRSPGAAPAAASFLAALAGRAGGLRQRAQRLVDKVNESRKADHAVMSDFRESLLLQVSALAEQLEERLFRLYDAHNGLIQERLLELAAAAERIARLQGELRRACRALEAAYRDLCLQPEP